MLDSKQNSDYAVAVREARALRVAGIAQGEVLTGPQTVHFDLANGCNTNCVTCWDHSPLLDAPRSVAWKRLTVDGATFQRLAAELAEMRSVEAVILSGMGDPFVNADIYDFIATSKNHGWQVTVLTNALLADARRVLELETDMLLISVNGVTPESYTAFHPNLSERDFRHLCNLLETFAQAGRRFKQVQVINRDTAPEVVDMVRFAANYNAASITYKLASLGAGTQSCGITDTQRQQLIGEWIPQAQAEAARLGVVTNLEVLARQVGAGGAATAPIDEIGCFMGWYYARITVEGRILLCCSTEVEVGHIARGTFAAQWYGAQWQEKRRALMDGNYFAGCEQCGKLNQNIKIAEKVREQLGTPLYYLRTGRTSDGQPRNPRRRLPVIA